MARSTAFPRSIIKAALVAAALASPLVASAEDTPDNVYLVVTKDSTAKPIVIFAFSDSTKTGYAPRDATALFAKPDYKPEGVFDPTEGCEYTFDFTTTLGDELPAKPMYGPASDQRLIDPFSLPSFMAREAVKALLVAKLVESEEAAAPYFNCTGFVWSQILKMTPEEWRRIMREQAEIQLKGKK